jgi:hypothetical protein
MDSAGRLEVRAGRTVWDRGQESGVRRQFLDGAHFLATWLSPLGTLSFSWLRRFEIQPFNASTLYPFNFFLLS